MRGSLYDLLPRFRAAVVRSCCSPPSSASGISPRAARARRQHGPGIRQADGRDRDAGKSAMPGPLDVGAKMWEHLSGRSTTTAERQGARHPARLFDRAGRPRLFPRRARRDPARLSDRHVAADEQGARSLHPGAQADLAARLDAAGALHHQGFGHLGDLRDLHLLGMADAAQHRVRRRGGAQGMAQRRAHAGSRHRPRAPSP